MAGSAGVTSGLSCLLAALLRDTPPPSASAMPQVFLGHLDPWPTHTCAAPISLSPLSPHKGVSLPSSKVCKYTGQMLIPGLLRKTLTVLAPPSYPEHVSLSLFFKKIFLLEYS